MNHPHGQDGRWQESLAKDFDQLGRWIEGRVLLSPAPGDECVPAERYRRPEVLHAAITRAAAAVVADAAQDPGAGDRDDGTQADLDLRIAVSRLTRHYTAPLTFAAIAGLAWGAGIDLAASRCTMVIRFNVPFVLSLDPRASVLGCVERSARWPLPGPAVRTLSELRQRVWRGLYAQNIAPLFEQVTAQVGVSAKLLWANAAEAVGMISDAAEEYLGPIEAQPFIIERRALLEAESLPGLAGPNPLRGQLDWVPVAGSGNPAAVQTRRMCCLTYLLRDRHGRLCQNCPYLPVADRVALIRERHGVAVDQTRNGPALQRSIDVGRAKLSRDR
jgi:hypothetical protein